ncbi:MAG: histidine phosphatase family protein [Candidatus Acidiferrales bacterium]
MSRVFLVRHAQASFLEPNYDKLSTLGEKQARLLGDYWARHEIVFHRVVSGPCVRQIDTAGIVGKAYRKDRRSFPELGVMPEFDEYQGEAVLERSLPALVEKDARIRKLHQQYIDSRDPTERAKTFQKLFEAVINKWVNGEILVPGVESWTEFCARVNRGLSHFISGGGRGEQTAIFCSGGPIAVAMHRALNLSPQDTLRVAWMSRNCSYSEFVYSDERFTLSSFNVFPHLEEASLLTYR